MKNNYIKHAKNRSIRMYDDTYERLMLGYKSKKMTQADYMHMIIVEQNEEVCRKIIINKDMDLVLEDLKEIIRDKDEKIRLLNKKIFLLKNELKNHMDKEFNYMRENSDLKVELSLKEVENR